MNAFEKLLNEVPTIAVAVWAVLNAFGIIVPESDQATWVSGIMSVGGFALWLLVRHSTDGPVTAMKNNQDHHDQDLDH